MNGRTLRGRCDLAEVVARWSVDDLERHAVHPPGMRSLAISTSRSHAGDDAPTDVVTSWAMVGAWEPATMKGFEVTGEPGTPSWFELHTRDYDKAVSFYREVFKWDTHTASDTDEFRYTTLGEGENQLAGIMDDTVVSGDEDPAHWAIYFKVEDADATLDKVVELGGRVVQPAVDTPYGRLARAANPTGADFRIVAG